MRDTLSSSNDPLYQLAEARSIYQLLKTRAERDAKAIALMAHDRAPLTYKGLLDQVEKTVGVLRAFGLRPNDRVAVALANGPEMAVAFVAVAAGVTCAPLNPGYRESEFDFYISDLRAKALIVRSGVDSPARTIAKRYDIPIIELTPALESEAGIFALTGKTRGLPNTPSFANADDIALVLHTSGTTSRPKIVPLTHTNICRSGHNISRTLKLNESDRCLNVMPLFHIHGLIGAIVSSLTAGASVVCTPGFDAEKFFVWLDTFRPSWYSAVPTMHHAVLARAVANREIIARAPLRFIRSSSAALPKQVMASLEEVFNAPVIESYSMTEASHQMTSNPLPPLLRKPGSVGMAAGPEIAIMDEAGNLLPPGQIGEVVIRGINVTNGYENNPTANQSTFVNGWFRTGDQGRVDADGYLFLTGRIKEIINRGGEKIAPKEIDELLMQHPAIAQAVAFAMPHPTLGEDVAAAVILNGNMSVTESEIRAFASARLADTKVPRRIVIVDDIPKGPTGKLQRVGLAEKLALKLQTTFVSARNQVEEQVAETWKDLLKSKEIGVRDNFFVIGGDSLTASLMMLEIERRFNATIRIADFLKAPTIETIARLIIDGNGSSVPATDVSGRGNGSKPIKDSFLTGLRNRLLQVIALYAPGFKTTRVWLHRRRGVSIGKNVSIGTSALIETAYPTLVSIGNNVTIGMRVIIIGHLRDLTEQAISSNSHTVTIEDDVYLGPGAIVLPNVTIGRGSVVSAGSVVSRSIPPQTLAQGNPAKPIARCGVSLGGGVSYEQFLRHLTPIEGAQSL